MRHASQVAWLDPAAETLINVPHVTDFARSAECGTAGTDRDDSPGTQSEGRDYSRNVSTRPLEAVFTFGHLVDA